MKKIALSILAILGFTFSSNAQSDGTLLYEITGNGITSPSYLYGTIHLMCESDFIMPEALKEKITDIEQIVLEIDMDDPNMMAKMQSKMAMNEGANLKTLVSTEDYEILDTYFKNEMGMPLAQLSVLKPMILSSFLYPKILGCPIKSYEMELVEAAKSEEIEVLGLETIEFQMGMFDEIPYDKQAQMLVEMVSKTEEAAAEFGRLVTAYKSGNITDIQEMMKKSSFDLEPEMMVKMLDDRNLNWIPRIKEMSNEKTSVFAVGAAHLAGKNGVIALLEKEGFTIKPIK